MIKILVIFLVVVLSTVNGSPVRGRHHKSKHELRTNQEVRTIVSAIVDAILDGDRKRRSEVVDTNDDEGFEPRSAWGTNVKKEQGDENKRLDIKKRTVTRGDEAESDQHGGVRLASVIATSDVNATEGQSEALEEIVKKDIVARREQHVEKDSNVGMDKQNFAKSSVAARDTKSSRLPDYVAKMVDNEELVSSMEAKKPTYYNQTDAHNDGAGFINNNHVQVGSSDVVDKKSSGEEDRNNTSGLNDEMISGDHNSGDRLPEDDSSRNNEGGATSEDSPQLEVDKKTDVFNDEDSKPVLGVIKESVSNDQNTSFGDNLKNYNTPKGTHTPLVHVNEIQKKSASPPAKFTWVDSYVDNEPKDMMQAESSWNHSVNASSGDKHDTKGQQTISNIKISKSNEKHSMSINDVNKLNESIPKIRESNMVLNNSDVVADKKALSDKDSDMSDEDSEDDDDNNDSKIKDDDFESKDDDAKARNNEMEPKDDEMESTDDEMESKDDEMESKDDEMESKDNEMEPKDNEMESKDDEMELKDDEMESKNNDSEPTDDDSEAKDDDMEQEEDETKPKDDDSEPKDDDSEANDNDLELKDNDSKQKDDDSEANDDDLKPKDDDSESEDDNSEANDDDLKPKDDDSKQKDDNSEANDDDLKPKDDDSESEDDNSEANDDDLKLKDDDSESEDDNSEANDDDLKPKDDDSQNDFNAKANQSVVKHKNLEARLDSDSATADYKESNDDLETTDDDSEAADADLQHGRSDSKYETKAKGSNEKNILDTGTEKDEPNHEAKMSDSGPRKNDTSQVEQIGSPEIVGKQDAKNNDDSGTMKNESKENDTEIKEKGPAVTNQQAVDPTLKIQQDPGFKEDKSQLDDMESSLNNQENINSSDGIGLKTPETSSNNNNNNEFELANQFENNEPPVGLGTTQNVQGETANDVVTFDDNTERPDKNNDNKVASNEQSVVGNTEANMDPEKLPEDGLFLDGGGSEEARGGTKPSLENQEMTKQGDIEDQWGGNAAGDDQTVKEHWDRNGADDQTAINSLAQSAAIGDDFYYQGQTGDDYLPAENNGAYAKYYNRGLENNRAYGHNGNQSPMDVETGELTKNNFIPNVVEYVSGRPVIHELVENNFNFLPAPRSDIYRHGPEVSVRRRDNSYERHLKNSVGEQNNEAMRFDGVVTPVKRDRDFWAKRSITESPKSNDNDPNDPLSGLLGDVGGPWMKDFLTKTLEMAVNGNPHIKIPTHDDGQLDLMVDHDIPAETGNTGSIESLDNSGDDNMPADATKVSDDYDDDADNEDDGMTEKDTNKKEDDKMVHNVSLEEEVKNAERLLEKVAPPPDAEVLVLPETTIAAAKKPMKAPPTGKIQKTSLEISENIPAPVRPATSQLPDKTTASLKPALLVEMKASPSPLAKPAFVKTTSPVQVPFKPPPSPLTKPASLKTMLTTQAPFKPPVNIASSSLGSSTTPFTASAPAPPSLKPATQNLAQHVNEPTARVIASSPQVKMAPLPGHAQVSVKISAPVPGSFQESPATETMGGPSETTSVVNTPLGNTRGVNSIRSELDNAMINGIQSSGVDEEMEKASQESQIFQELKNAIPLESQRPANIDSDVIQGLEDLADYASALAEAAGLSPDRHDEVAKELVSGLLDDIKVSYSRREELLETLMTYVVSKEVETVKEHLSEVRAEVLRYAETVSQDPIHIRGEAIRLLDELIDNLPLLSVDKLRKQNEMLQSRLLEKLVEEGKRRVLQGKLRKALVHLVTDELL